MGTLLYVQPSDGLVTGVAFLLGCISALYLLIRGLT